MTLAATDLAYPRPRLQRSRWLPLNGQWDSFNNTTSGTTWRIFYTLLQQQNASLIENNEVVAGEEVTRALETMRGWVESG